MGSEDPQDLSSTQEPGSHLPASTPSADPKKPKHEFPQSQVGKLWDAFGNPESQANILADATYKPRGKAAKDVSYSEVIGEVSLAELAKVHKQPCTRDALLTGIGAGFGVGGIRAVFATGGARVFSSAANWAVVAGVIAAAATFELCQKHRRDELNGMKEAVELMKALKDKKQREKEMASQRIEEEKRKKSWTNPDNYKFW
ncbi:hypothetical protein N7495_008528 [Penicillium taxi]|uniref:uncharacterized protein n=1 Tax=Penicillium taxi TaxID=168475 RepID=UPI002545B9E9|nr:uncharacterized protein N7495_008528 [Penicillium taxi]KAJ5888487.1 hypothetical protein N7495_008528 [Penicillium taxi]